MIQGRPVRSCTKNRVIYGNSRKKNTKIANGTSKQSVNTLKKNETITDFFKSIDIIEETFEVKKIQDIHRNVCLNKEVPKSVVKEETLNAKETTTNCCKEKNEEEEGGEQVRIMTLNNTKSPSTPHRITLCGDAKEEVEQNGKLEGKNFQKPTIAPKAKKKLLSRDVDVLAGNNYKLTDYFPVRRSVRKTKTTVLEEKQRDLEKTLRNNKEEGLKICHFEGKGRGIVADKQFKKGDYVVEYSGDLIDMTEAKKREEIYALDQNTGCYMYYFKHNGQQYCIDATPETDKLGRLVNHSRNGNLMTRSISVDGKPRLVLIAKEDINVGEEILYDYGDRSKESLRHHPWLAN